MSLFCLSCCYKKSSPRDCILAVGVLVSIIVYLPQVIGKFSIRIVPHQTPELVEAVTLAYLNKKWSQRKTPNKLRMWCDGDRGWVGDTNNDNFQAGIRLVGSLVSPTWVCWLYCNWETLLRYPSSSTSTCLPGSIFD